MTCMELIICRGLQGSGKTSWAKQLVKRNPHTHVRVSRDDLREAFYVSSTTPSPKDEDNLTVIQHNTIRQMFIMKKNVVVDDMNLNLRSVEGLYDVAQEFNGTVQIRFQDFAVPVKTCIQRDAARAAAGERSVGEKAIKETVKRYLNGGNDLPELPAYFYERITAPEPLQQDANLPHAWIVDFDGTIAKMVDRGPFDWNRVDEDAPIEHAIQLVRDLHHSGQKIIIISGRDGTAEQGSLEWLKAWDVPYDEFILREAGDSRKDFIFKNEIYETRIKGKYFISGCLDDRHQVVQHYRKLGLFVAQVDNGLF